jgi:hypothetical protein
MSVREQLYLQTRIPPEELVHLAAGLIGGRARDCWLLVETAHLVPGASGEFGGPVIAHESELPFRPLGEFEAIDCYTVEIRLWQAHGRRIHPDTGENVEALASDRIFRALADGIAAPIIHVRNDDKLVQASMPGRGIRGYPDGTTIYEWDVPAWDGYVVIPR